MARRRLRESDDSDLAEFAALQQQQDPRISMAMQLLKMMEGQRSDVADRAYKERAMEAERMWREGQLEDTRKQERRLTAGAEEAKRQYEEEKIIRQRQRDEDIAREKEKEKLALSEKEKDRIATEKKQKVADLDTMVDRGIITKEQAIPYYDKLNPEFAEMAKDIKAQEDEKLFRKNLGEYRKLSPKDRSKLLPETYGGPENLQRIKDAAEGYTYEPGGPSAMPGKIIADWKPRLEPAVSEPPMRVGYGQPLAEPQAYSYATRAPQTVPAVGGMTTPTIQPEAVPTETTEDFIKRVQAQPEAFGGGVPLPTSEEITSGIESDQQPSFLDNLLRQISEYSASRPERTPVERYPYPIGHGVPPTPPIDPSLLNPKVMPMGYGR